jgi:hypothetical protein
MVGAVGVAAADSHRGKPVYTKNESFAPFVARAFVGAITWCIGEISEIAVDAVAELEIKDRIP